VEHPYTTTTHHTLPLQPPHDTPNFQPFIISTTTTTTPNINNQYRYFSNILSLERKKNNQNSWPEEGV